MPTLHAYIKQVTAVTTHTLRLPDAPQGTQSGQEIATLPDGRTVVVIYDGYALDIANQPASVKAGIETLTLTPELKAQIKAASPHVRLIQANMLSKIRAAYSAEDEAFFARIGVGVALGAYTFEPGEQAALLAFGAFVEGVREWGRDERAKLGL